MGDGGWFLTGGGAVLAAVWLEGGLSRLWSRPPAKCAVAWRWLSVNWWGHGAHQYPTRDLFTNLSSMHRCPLSRNWRFAGHLVGLLRLGEPSIRDVLGGLQDTDSTPLNELDTGRTVGGWRVAQQGTVRRYQQSQPGPKATV